MELILASKSPRRNEILSSLGVSFKIIPAVGEEVVLEGLSAKESVISIAKPKAFEIFEKYPDCAVIGADTIVVMAKKFCKSQRMMKRNTKCFASCLVKLI